MPGELQGLQFVVSVDTQGSESKLDTLAKALERLARVTGLSAVGRDLQDFAKKANSINTDKLDRLSEALKKIKMSKSAADNTKSFVDAANALTDDTVARWERMAVAFGSNGFASLGSALAGLGNIQVTEDTARNMQDFVGALYALDQQTIQNWAQMAAILQSIPQVNIPNLPQNANAGANGAATSASVPAQNQAAQSAGASAVQMQQATNAASGLSKALNLATGSASKLATGIGGVVKATAQATTALPRMVGERFFTKVKQATAGMGQFLGSLKRVAMYRLIRSAIAALTQGFQEGIKNLYAYSNALGTVFAQSMDRLASSSLYLKNSLAAMAAPIINAIVPAVETAIDAIVKLFNYINMLISALTGKSVTTIAKKVGTSFDNAAGSAGGANKAAKELKKTILGFDELNVLNDQNNGSGGGGGGAGGGGAFSDMFEEVEVPTDISDFAKRLREAFEAQDWMELGKILGEKFNEVVDSIQWDKLGDKVGGGLRAVIDTSLSFLRTADFQNVGKHFAEFFNNAISAVDWGNLGALLVRKVTALVDIVIGFIKELDFGQVTAAISDFIVGFWEEITAWLNGIDWKELGTSIGHGLVDAVQNIKVSEIVGALGRVFEALASAVWGLVSGVFEAVYEDIVGWLNKKTKKEKITPFKLSIFNNAKELWDNFKEWLANRVLLSPFVITGTKIENNASNLWRGFEILLGAAQAISPFLIISKLFDNTNEIWRKILLGLVKAMTLSPFQIIPELTNNSGSLWERAKAWWREKSSGGFEAKVNISSNVDTIINAIKSKVRNLDLETKINFKKTTFKVEWATSSYNGNKVQYPKITPQYAAHGAILDAATLFGSPNNALIAGESGREAILPLDRNTGWMDDIADRLATRTSDGDNYTSTYMALVDFYQAYVRDSMVSMTADMRRQADKDETVSVSADSVTAALARKNLRDGRTVVPVG